MMSPRNSWNTHLLASALNEVTPPKAINAAAIIVVLLFVFVVVVVVHGSKLVAAFP